MRHAKGFSIVELMVVITILSIVSAIALPSFSAMLASQKIKSTSFDLIASLSFARGEGVKRNTTITVAPINNNWANGWTIADGTTVLRTNGSTASNLSITLTGATSLVYGRSGRVTTGNGATFQVGTTDNSANPRCITIDAMGIPRAKTGACS